MNTAGDLSV